MRRWLTLALFAALCLALAACGSGSPAAPSPDAPAVPASAAPEPAAPEPAAPLPPLRLDTLNVEFASRDRSTDALLKLRGEFPQALIDALAKQDVEVGSAAVTFGTSGEATEAALQNGAVQLAFLSAEDYYPYRGGMIVAVELGETPDLALGLVVSAVSDDAAADERLTEALRGALPELAPALASYTGAFAKGRYEYDEERLDQLAAMYEKDSARGGH